MFKVFEKYKKIKNKKRGISLVIAVTTMTLLLSISLSVSGIVLRQIKINALNNSSKPAFFIADSAMECAFYYDTVYIASTTPTENANLIFETMVFGPDLSKLTGVVKCGEGEVLAFNKNTSDPNKIISTFDIDYGNNTCAKVEVIRTDVSTQITTRGYNTGVISGVGCDLSNTDVRRIVERGLTIKY